MKKYLACTVVLTLLLALTGGAVSAAGPDSIIEVPDVKIIMDGRITNFTDVPVCVGQNTLLPLRELFNNLGIPDENISYNNQNKSVTVTKDQTRLYMEVGNLTALLNDKPVMMNTAPVGYAKNQRIYIPFRFAAEAFGKKVVWDGTSRSILVCDAVKYDSLKQILDQSAIAMKQLTGYSAESFVTGTSQTGSLSFGVSLETKAQVDKLNKAMHIKMNLRMLGKEIPSDAYYYKNTSYVFRADTGKWLKKTFSQTEYEKLFTDWSNNDILYRKPIDPLCAGLMQENGSNPDEILLKGDVYMNDVINTAAAGQVVAGLNTARDTAKFDTCSVEISLNRYTYLVNHIIMTIGLSQPVGTDGAKKAETNISTTVVYTNFNSGIPVTVPEDVIRNTAS